MPDIFYDVWCTLTCEIGGEAYVIEGRVQVPEDVAVKENWVYIEDDEGAVKAAIKCKDIRVVEVA